MNNTLAYLALLLALFLVYSQQTAVRVNDQCNAELEELLFTTGLHQEIANSCIQSNIVYRDELYASHRTISQLQDQLDNLTSSMHILQITSFALGAIVILDFIRGKLDELPGEYWDE